MSMRYAIFDEVHVIEQAGGTGRKYHTLNDRKCMIRGAPHTSDTLRQFQHVPMHTQITDDVSTGALMDGSVDRCGL